jgi:hypothetical protein
MNAQIEHTLDAANFDFGFHVLWLVPMSAGDEALQVSTGKAKLSLAWKRLKRRLKRSLGSNLLAQALAVAAGEPALQLASVPIRLTWARLDVATGALELIDARRRRINAIEQALGSDGPTKALTLARASLLFSSRSA